MLIADGKKMGRGPWYMNLSGGSKGRSGHVYRSAQTIERENILCNCVKPVGPRTPVIFHDNSTLDPYLSVSPWTQHGFTARYNQAVSNFVVAFACLPYQHQ